MIIGFVKLLEKHNPDLSPGQVLDLYQNRTCHGFIGQFPFGKQLGIVDDPPTQRTPWHYVYSEQHGWIDMGHFLTMARLGRRSPNNVEQIEKLAQMYEDYTAEVGKQNPTIPGFGSSANTPEDPISNKLGISSVQL